MPEPCPLVQLHQELRRELHGVDSAALLTELGVPANLQSLVVGLRRTRTCLQEFPDELDVCLRVLPEERLDSEALIGTIEQVLQWADRQPWPEGDLRRLPMERSGATARHPLAGYCLSILLHWSDLYYVLEPEAPAGNERRGLADSFESLVAEFSGYVIAAQAAIDPAEYIGFCRKWWGAARLPDAPLYPTRRLASRVAGASRAVRRLSRVEHRALLQFLLDPANGAAFHERIFRAMQTAEFAPEHRPPVTPRSAPDVPSPAGLDHAVEADWLLLQQMALLLEEVRPGWTRPNTVRRRRGTRRGAKRTHSQHRTFQDGYVRLPEQDVIRFDFTTDDGLAVEHLQPLLANDADNLAEVWTRDLDATGAGPGNEPERTPEDAVDRKRRAIRNGTEWIPVGEQQTDADIDVVVVVPGSQGEPGTSTPQGAREHVRRFHLALGVGKDRLSLAQILHLLKEISRIARSSADMALLALHVSIALGRSIHQVEGIEVHAGRANPDVDPDRIHYFLGSRQWVFNSPVPAWADMPAEPIEQPRLRQLWLDDRTGFHSLAEQYGLLPGEQAPSTCRPFQKLTQKSRGRLDAFLKQALPQADVTLAKCAGFLFHRILAVSQGDLGVASLITGHEHSHSSSVRHYANYPAGPVWAAYFGAWLEDWEQYLTDGTAAAGTSPNGRKRHYGAKRVPKASAVQSLASMLARRVRDATLPSSVRHNCYTAYTLVGMVLGLGMRPVIEPLVTGAGGYADDKLLVSFVDKARSDYDRRINPLPEALAQHLGRYTAYRNALAATLPSRLAHTNFVHRGPGSRDAAIFRPGDFAELADGGFPLELYSLRRFVRTELASRYHVAAEDLDAYMGHWLFGVSPFDPLSTYPMQRLYDLGAGPLTQLLKNMGFAPLEPP